MIKIFDNKLNFIGSLDIFNSFQCSAKYADSGSFTIKALLTPQTEKFLRIGNLIQYKDFAGVIDSIQKNEESDKAPTINANGSDLVGLLSTRIIWENSYFNGKTEDFLQKIVNENAINPKITNRKIPFLKLSAKVGLPQKTERNTEYETLLEECKKVCKVADYGFTILLDARTKSIYFKVYEGEDRTIGTPHQVIIGRNYDNVLAQDYTISNKDEITTCLTIAEGIQPLIIGDEISGFARKETILKSSQKQEELSLAQFQNVLKSEAKEKLEDKTECFDVDVFNVSLAVGNKITVKDKLWNIQFNTRITERQITVQDGMETITYLIGNDIKLKERK